jgi:hypothetical protein
MRDPAIIAIYRGDVSRETHDNEAPHDFRRPAISMRCFVFVRASASVDGLVGLSASRLTSLVRKAFGSQDFVERSSLRRALPGMSKAAEQAPLYKCPTQSKAFATGSARPYLRPLLWQRRMDGRP